MIFFGNLLFSCQSVRCFRMHALYYKYVHTIICTYTYITSIVFKSKNSLLANLYFTLYLEWNKNFYLRTGTQRDTSAIRIPSEFHLGCSLHQFKAKQVTLGKQESDTVAPLPCKTYWAYGFKPLTIRQRVVSSTTAQKQRTKRNCLWWTDFIIYHVESDKCTLIFTRSYMR